MSVLVCWCVCVDIILRRNTQNCLTSFLSLVEESKKVFEYDLFWNFENETCYFIVNRAKSTKRFNKRSQDQERVYGTYNWKVKQTAQNRSNDFIHKTLTTWFHLLIGSVTNVSKACLRAIHFWMFGSMILLRFQGKFVISRHSAFSE